MGFPEGFSSGGMCVCWGGVGGGGGSETIQCVSLFSTVPFEMRGRGS